MIAVQIRLFYALEKASQKFVITPSGAPTCQLCIVLFGGCSQLHMVQPELTAIILEHERPSSLVRVLRMEPDSCLLRVARSDPNDSHKFELLAVNFLACQWAPHSLEIFLP